MRRQAVTDVFAALGDGTRLSVVKKLAGGPALSATALAADATVSRQAIVKHLHVLEGVGLVTHKKHGREVRYTLETREIERARAFLHGIAAGWDRALDRLRQAVETPSTRARPKKIR